MNRLKLDFSLNSTVERTNFLNDYINKLNFVPNEAELETMANYILWGKDPQTGLNVKQSKEIQLESRNKTWDTTANESLEALLETPGFSESMIRSINEPVIKITRQVFSRAEARKLAPKDTLKHLEQLWQQIDNLDLLLNFYDLKTGKRKNPPRESLLKNFTNQEIEAIKEKANSLNQFKYLKLRHLLVELRREQFTIRDTYINSILCSQTPSTDYILPPTLDADILCAPIGLKYSNAITSKLFPEGRFPIPEDFEENELKQIIKFYWERQKFYQNNKCFDFREPEHIYQIFQLFDNLTDEAEESLITSTSPEFLQTLNWYIDRANLSEIHKKILKFKIEHYKNQDIANNINKEYNKSYTANYISTIFKQKIIPQISTAARNHCDIIENLCFPENWKKCKTCNTTLLINANNFVRKTRSSDGFSNQCKICDKIKRLLNK